MKIDRDLIDNMIQGCLWNRYVAEPRFLTMLHELTKQEREQLPEFMLERCVKIIADMDLNQRINTNQINFLGYVLERLAILDALVEVGIDRI